jgi:hypothetical protein
MSWTTVWDHTGGSFSDSSWTLQIFDISAIADGRSTVYIRWCMGPTDGSVTYPGWNIDDVEIWGVAPLPSATLTGAASIGWHDAAGSYAGGEQVLPVDFALGVVEPREMQDGGVWLNLTFDHDVAADDVSVAIDPPPGVGLVVAPGAAANEVAVQFDDAMPVGAYAVTVEVTGQVAGTFPICYVPGDVNCSGDTTGLDLGAVQSPANWNRDLAEGADPRADVNRDGQVTGLDLARVQAPANWNQPVPALDCGCM